MSHILSKVESIDNLRFDPFPPQSKKPVTGRAISTDRAVVMLGDDGRIYTDAVKKNVAYMDTGMRLENVLRACVKLGALSTKAVDQHKAIVSAYSAQREREWAAEAIDEHLTTLGIKLTAQQRAKVNAASKPLPK